MRFLLLSEIFGNASSTSSVTHVLLETQVLTHLWPYEGGEVGNLFNSKLHFPENKQRFHAKNYKMCVAHYTSALTPVTD